ncbi:phosphatase PAP2 family protein [Sphingomonas hankyongi]|uniref:Phosphatase PAP2 family protein n=1 Tax=Sphingomonas hankyongi TaxID=2908209 RepID=A0ABT0S3J9_9SPHN|nr:phosphatase PAP2 family protein [Sphingomonas hankyongi]
MPRFRFLPRSNETASDLDWIVPGIVLTAALSAFSLTLMPDRSGVLPALMLLPLWTLAAVGMAAFAIMLLTLKMMVQGIEGPLKIFRAYAVENRKALGIAFVGIILTGLNMIAFMWTKPLLNHLVPFWADPLLARIDHSLFFTDPWRLLTFLNTDPWAIFYHRGWFALMILILLKVLMSPASSAKTAILLTYFFLWSVFGPVVHSLLPAGGPVFFGPLGYGPQFQELLMTPKTREVAGYLWDAYTGTGFGAGAGISAMPSLHIATTAWVVIATAVFARNWLVVVSILSALIFLLSVALGWHYAVDGLVGGAAALGIWRMSLWFVRPPPEVRL